MLSDQKQPEHRKTCNRNDAQMNINTNKIPKDLPSPSSNNNRVVIAFCFQPTNPSGELRPRDQNPFVSVRIDDYGANHAGLGQFRATGEGND